MKLLQVNNNGNYKETEYLNAIKQEVVLPELISDADRVHVELPVASAEGKHVWKILNKNESDNLSLGTISSFGFATTPTWSKLHGMEVTLLTTRNTGWFNIDGVLSGSEPTGYESILPQNPDGFYRLKSATFRYSNHGWNVIAFTPLDEKYDQGLQGNKYLNYSIEGSDLVLDGNVPTGFNLFAVKDHYYKIKLSGKVDISPSNNDMGVDFTKTPIYTQMYMDNDINFTQPTTLVRSKQNNYTSGSTLNFSDEFIVFEESDKTVAFNITHINNDNLADQVSPTAEYQNFSFKVEIELLPKDEWHYHFVIPSQPLSGMANFIIDLPATDFLPFDGYYQADVYVEVAELDGAMFPVNLTIPQSLSIGRSGGGSPRTVDLSVTHIPAAGATSKVINNSLKGAAIIKTRRESESNS